MAAIVYQPPALATQLENFRVRSIRAVAHQPIKITQGQTLPNTNHWALYLKTATNQSIRVDMRTDPNSNLLVGYLEISKLSYEVSVHASKVCELRPKSNLRVSEVVTAIVNAGYAAYQFTPPGIGCRHWNVCVIELLVQRGIITQGHQSAIAALNTTWYGIWNVNSTEAPPQFRTGLDTGTFL